MMKRLYMILALAGVLMLGLVLVLVTGAAILNPTRNSASTSVSPTPSTPAQASEKTALPAAENAVSASGSTFTSDPSMGSEVWTRPENARASDDLYASANLATGNQTRALRATGFGFAIPDGAVIRGVVVEVEQSELLPGATIQNDQVRLVVSGGIQGENRAGGVLTTEDDVQTYGSPTDTWVLTLTPSKVNSSDFGVALSYLALLDDTIRVDHIQITVYYHSP